MKVKTEDLRLAFEVVSRVPANDVLESSQYVRLKQSGKELTLSITGTLWAEASVTGLTDGGKWTTYADRRVLRAFLSTAKDTETEMFYAKDKLTLKAGQRLEIAAHAPINGYETWAPKSSFDLSDFQKAAVKTGIKYLPSLPGSEHVEAIYFGKGYGTISTDTLFIMSVLGGSPSDFYLPTAIANVVASNDGKIAVDKAGVGIALNNGFVYQPQNAALDRYPSDKLKAVIETASKEANTAVLKSEELRDTLAVASQFLLDKSMDRAHLEKVKNALQVSVDMPTGKFQRNLSTVGECKLSDGVDWPIKQLLPWLDYAAPRNSEIEYSQISGANVFRFEESKRSNLFVFANI